MTQRYQFDIPGYSGMACITIYNALGQHERTIYARWGDTVIIHLDEQESFKLTNVSEVQNQQLQDYLTGEMKE